MSGLDRFLGNNSDSAPMTLVFSGLPGSGKSSLTLHFPQVLVLDVEGSMQGKRVPEGSAVIRIKSWDQFKEVVGAIKEDPGRFQCVAIDTLDVLWVMLAGHTPQWQDHGRLYGVFQNALEELKRCEVHLLLSCHVQRVAIAGVQQGRNGQTPKQYRLDLREKLRVWLEGWADVVLYFSEAQGRYSITARPSLEAYAKDRTDRLNRVIHGGIQENQRVLWKALGMGPAPEDARPATPGPRQPVNPQTPPPTTKPTPRPAPVEMDERLQLFHTERKQAGLSVEEVRAHLTRRFGGKTTRDLSDIEAEQLLSWMRGQGQQNRDAW